MNLSQLISQLTKFKTKFGDVEVVMFSGDEEGNGDIFPLHSEACAFVDPKSPKGKEKVLSICLGPDVSKGKHTKFSAGDGIVVLNKDGGIEY